MWLNSHFCQRRRRTCFNGFTFNCLCLRSNVFLIRCVHVWLPNNYNSLKLETSRFFVLLKQRLFPRETKLDFQVELISLFTNYSHVIVLFCCFVLLVSSSANQMFLYFEIVRIHDSVFQQRWGFVLETRRPTVWLYYSSALPANHLLSFCSISDSLWAQEFLLLFFFYSLSPPIVTVRCPLWNHRSTWGSPVSSATWRESEHSGLSVRAEEGRSGERKRNEW